MILDLFITCPLCAEPIQLPPRDVPFEGADGKHRLHLPNEPLAQHLTDKHRTAPTPPPACPHCTNTGLRIKSNLRWYCDHCLAFGQLKGQEQLSDDGRPPDTT